MEERDMTAADLARKLDVSHQAVSQVLSGERGKMPQSLLNLMEVMGLELVVCEKG